MLETLREYGLERLSEASEAAQIGEQHAFFYLALAEGAEPKLRGPEQKAWLDLLETEHDNLRAVLTGARERGEIQTSLRMAGTLWRFWFAHGHLTEGRHALEAALSTSGHLRTPARAKVFYGTGRLSALQGDYASARAFFEESLSIYREAGDRLGAANVLNDLANVVGLQGDYAQKGALLEESLAVFRELGDEQGIATTLFLRGNVASRSGDHALARSLFEESLATFRKLGDRRSIAMCLYCLGDVAFESGDYGAAQKVYKEGLEVFRELKDKQSIARSLASLGNAACRQQDYDAARSLLEESLGIFRELGAKQGIADTMASLGDVAFEQGDYTSARSLIQESLLIRRDMGNRRGVVECLEALARTEARSQDPPDMQSSQWATKLLGAAAALRDGMKSPLPPAVRAQQEMLVELLRSRLGEAEWAAAWGEGEALDLEEAVAYALEKSWQHPARE
jgi:tetratricopeptide (TPR) repeat protein